MEIIFALVVTGIIYFVLKYASEDARTRREMRRAPQVPIAHARPDQLVRLTGKVGSTNPLVAPFSGAPCAYYRLRVKYARRVETFVDTSEARELELDDGTGRAVITASAALKIAVPAGAARGHWGAAEPKRLEVLTRFGRQDLAGAAAELTFIEERISDGDEITAYGHVDVDVDADAIAPGADYRTARPRVSMRQPLRITAPVR